MAGLASPASAARTGEPKAGGPAKFTTFPGRLYSVAATDANNVWAAGLHPDSSLIVHWNGTAWTQSFSSSLGYFIGVATDSRTDAWAVGGTNWFSPTSTLIEHWNGSGWTRVPSPSPDGGGYLNGVTAISRTDAWAVGLIASGGPGNSGATTTPLIEHWDGTAWTQVPCPVPASGGEFTSVSATSPTDVWAAGSTGGSSQQALIEHWNGTAWSPVPSPNPPAGYLNALLGVVAICPHNVWAVGTTDYAQTLITHWNGKTWS